MTRHSVKIYPDNNQLALYFLQEKNWMSFKKNYKQSVMFDSKNKKGNKYSHQYRKNIQLPKDYSEEIDKMIYRKAIINKENYEEISTNKQDELLIDMKYFEQSSVESSTEYEYSKVSSQKILENKSRINYYQKQANKRIQSSKNHVNVSENSIKEESEDSSKSKESKPAVKIHRAPKLKTYLQSLDLVNDSRGLLPKRMKSRNLSSAVSTFSKNKEKQRFLSTPHRTPEASAISNSLMKRPQSDLSLLNQSYRAMH